MDAVLMYGKVQTTRIIYKFKLINCYIHSLKGWLHDATLARAGISAWLLMKSQAEISVRAEIAPCNDPLMQGLLSMVVNL